MIVKRGALERTLLSMWLSVLIATSHSAFSHLAGSSGLRSPPPFQKGSARICAADWTNMYKLASATRHDRVVYDLMGPWYIEGTNWPDLHCEPRAQRCAG